MPNRYGLEPLLVQAVVPLLFMITVAVKPAPALTVPGTLLLTYEALSTKVELIRKACKVVELPLSTSASHSPDTPETDAVQLYCQKVQNPQGPMLTVGLPLSALELLKPGSAMSSGQLVAGLVKELAIEPVVYTTGLQTAALLAAA